MKQKKLGLSAAALTLLAIMLVMAGCSGSAKNSSSGAESSAATPTASTASTPEAFPLQNPVTVKIVTVVTDGGNASKDVTLWQEIEKQTNIHVDFQDINSSQWNEKKGLLFASNELPEAFIGHSMFTDADLLNYGSTGALIPLEDLIDQYAPNIKKAFEEYPDLRKQLTAPDGHIYGIPSFISNWQDVKAGNILFVNKIWLDKLGMAVPTTTDEFEQMLLAFKEKDPGNVGDKLIPFTAAKNYEFFSPLFGSFGLVDHYPDDGYTHMGLKDGKAIYTAVQPEYKDALTYFNKLYSEGLIDIESFTNDSKAFSAKIKSDPRVVGAFLNWRSTSWASNPDQRNDYVPVGPLKGPNGDQLYEQYPSGLFFRGSFAITNNTKQPELLMRWIDNVVSDDNQMQMVNAGRFGMNMQKNADGTITMDGNLDPKIDEEKFSQPTNNSRINFMTMSNSKRLVSKTPVFTEKGEYDKLFEGHFSKDVYPNVFFSLDEAQMIATIGNDINTYANSMYAKWIINGGIDKEWDSYVKKLNDMGLNDLLAAYQSAYDRYQSGQ